MYGKTYFTLIVDSPMLTIGKNQLPYSFEELLSKLSTYCNDKSIPFNNIYVNSKKEISERQKEQLPALSEKIRLSEYGNIGYYVVLCNSSKPSDSSYYKIDKSDDLGTGIEFKELNENVTLKKYVEFALKYTNIIPIVIEYDFINDLNRDTLNTFFNKLFFTYGTPISPKKCEGKNKLFYRLDRKYFTSKFTLGELVKIFDEKVEHICYTLEDTVRFSTTESKNFKPNFAYPYSCNLCNDKVYKVTAIPCGIYKIQTVRSKNFGYAPKLYTIGGQEVPCYTSILMHKGVKADNSWGCILMGSKITNKNYGYISNDGGDFMNKITADTRTNCVYLFITQKVDGKDLNDEDIKKINNGEILGKI